MVLNTLPKEVSAWTGTASVRHRTEPCIMVMLGFVLQDMGPTAFRKGLIHGNEPIRNSFATFGFMGIEAVTGSSADKLQRDLRGWVIPQEHSAREEWPMSQAGAKRPMARGPVWIEEIPLRGVGCSECAWVFCFALVFPG
jgi:hypothetical protein